MIRVTGDDGFCTKLLLPKRLDAQFIVILVWTINNFKHFIKQYSVQKSNNHLFTKH